MSVAAYGMAFSRHLCAEFGASSGGASVSVSLLTFPCTSLDVCTMSMPQSPAVTGHTQGFMLKTTNEPRDKAGGEGGGGGGVEGGASAAGAGGGGNPW